MGQSIRAILLILTLAVVGSANAVDLPNLHQPNWTELTPQQREILAPLEDDWSAMEPLRRKKWIGIAARYPEMGEEEQQRIQRRMRNWVHLNPEQRKLAREKYKALRQAAPEKKAAVKQRWDAYKELSEEEKVLLQEAAKPKPLPKPGTVMRKPPLSPAAAMLMPRTKTATLKPQLSPAPSLVVPPAPVAVPQSVPPRLLPKR